MGADVLVWALTAGATTPDWITAVSTAVLGAFAAAFGVFQFTAEGFRPKVRLRIDATRTGISVEIRNKGRGAGVIARVVLVDKQGLALSPAAPVIGYPLEVFYPTTLPAHAAMRLIVGLPGGMNEFPEGIRVKVDWGTGGSLGTPLPTNVGYGGLPSVLPPSAQ